MASDPTRAPARPGLWIRRSAFGEAGEGVKDTNDHWLKLGEDLTARLFCYGCNDMVIVHMPDPDRLEAECCECGRTYEVEED